MDNILTILTIAIPTYNRKEILFKNIEILLKQIKPWVKIIVIDNCSELNLYEYIQQERWWKPGAIEFIRNQVNIGGNANVLRCIEVCNTKYLWILGDDDFPKNDALETIYQVIASREISWVNFYSSDEFQPKRGGGNEFDDEIKFLKGLKSINELVFISNNIYNTRILRSGVEVAYKNIQMMAPHLVAMLSGISSLAKQETKGKFIISNKEIFQSLSNNKNKKTNWDFFRIYTGLMTIYQVDFSMEINIQILRLIKGARYKWLTNKYLVKAFSELSYKYGISSAFRQSNNMIINLIYIDNVKSIFTIPLYLISVIFGKIIWKNKKFFIKIK